MTKRVAVVTGASSGVGAASVRALAAADVAEIVAFAATRPAHVDLDQIVVRPVAQAAAYLVHRTPNPVPVIM